MDGETEGSQNPLVNRPTRFYYYEGGNNFAPAQLVRFHIRALL
jgi:hypothetical protein